MPTKDRRVDAYIAGAAEFAKPILRHLRQLVHTACPEVEETLKWSCPAFLHKGMLCGMAAFKHHCTFGFWKHRLIIRQSAVNQAKAAEAMGKCGRITSLSDLPSDRVLLGYIRRAVELNERGIKVSRSPRTSAQRLPAVPPDLRAALKKNKKAAATFENFSPSHQREYIEWITEARREETRTKRLETTLAWLAGGKPRKWKYMNR